MNKPKESAVMRDLHKIRESIYKEIRNLSSRELIAYFNSGAARLKRAISLK
jgi:hypothetical protein